MHHCTPVSKCRSGKGAENEDSLNSGLFSIQKETQQIRTAEFQREILELYCVSDFKSNIMMWLRRIQNDHYSFIILKKFGRHSEIVRLHV